MWQAQIDDLSLDYHCLAVDLPGNGESYQVAWLSLADTAVQLTRIIQHKATGGKAHVVGLSLGGYTAVTLLANHPDVIASLIVSGVTTRPFPQQWFYRPLMAAMIPTMKWDVMIDMNMKMMQIPEEAAPLYRRDSKRVPKAALQRVYDEVFNFTLPAALAGVATPVLAVAGDKEAKLVSEGLTDFPALLPNSAAAVAPEAHHGWNGEHPELFSAMVRAWVAQRPLPEALHVITDKRNEALV
jgi:pimeloyl-ACP methyl ester carboxylesterase